jgi:hypothetical protein
MNDSIRLLLSMAAVLILSFALAACAGQSSGDADPSGDAVAEVTQTGDGERAERASEGDGEHEDEGESADERDEREGEHAGEGEGRGSESDERESQGEHSGERGEGEEGEHDEEGGHGEEGEGEESGVYVAAGETWDYTRRGARLILSFDADSGAFSGTVENTTNTTLCAVRVEVHLDGGPELGPTPHLSMSAGESVQITLSAEGNSVETWTAHPEVSRCSGA